MSTSSQEPVIAGFSVCVDCNKLVLAEVARKTQGRCVEHFATYVDPLLKPIILRGKDRQRMLVKVRSRRRSPAELAGRRRSKKRRSARPDVRERERLAAQAKARALSDLAATFPEMFEIYYADHRRQLGLDAWTIDRLVTRHVASETLEALAEYHSRPWPCPNS